MGRYDVQEIRALIERFMDADTTVAEEQRLFEYFSSGCVADGLEEYAPMFGWYASMCSREERPNHRTSRFLWLHWISAVAVVALLFTAGFYVREFSYNQKYMSYKGSFIVRDGKKITSLSVVGPEAERMEREFEERLRMAERQTIEFDERVNASMTAGFDMSNPTVREKVMECVNL